MGCWDSTGCLGEEPEVTKGGITSDWEEKVWENGIKVWENGIKMVTHKHVADRYSCLAIPCTWSPQSLLSSAYFPG